MFGIDDIGQGFGKLDHSRHIHKSGDIGTAAADKNTDSRGFALDIDFRGQLFGFRQRPSRICQPNSNLACSGTGIDNRSGNIFGLGEGTANIDAGSRALDRIKSAGFGKLVVIQINIQFLSQGNGLIPGPETHRQHNNIKAFSLAVAGRIDIANQVFAVFIHGLDMGNARFDKTNAQIVFGLVIIAFKVFTEGADVNVKDCCVQTVAAVLLG